MSSLLYVASMDEEGAAVLSDAYPNASSVSINAEHEKDRLNKLIGNQELVIR